MSKKEAQKYNPYMTPDIARHIRDTESTILGIPISNFVMCGSNKYDNCFNLATTLNECGDDDYVEMIDRYGKGKHCSGYYRLKDLVTLIDDFEYDIQNAGKYDNDKLIFDPNKCFLFYNLAGYGWVRNKYLPEDASLWLIFSEKTLDKLPENICKHAEEYPKQEFKFNDEMHYGLYGKNYKTYCIKGRFHSYPFNTITLDIMWGIIGGNLINYTDVYTYKDELTEDD